jgi:DNA processing protein
MRLLCETCFIRENVLHCAQFLIVNRKSRNRKSLMPVVEEKSRFLAGEEKYWLAFSRASQIGIVRVRRLFDYFGSLEEAWTALSGDLLAAGLDAKLVERLLVFRKSFSPDAELEKLATQNITLLALESPGYPERLAQIKQPPLVLYVRGEILPSDNFCVAVVGTRRATTYGKDATRQICRELAEQGVIIVSGMALGIDTVAHQAALAADKRTLAVLGSGVDVIYPSENRGLAAKIIENGALISELPPGSQPEANNFPARNRIVSGMALGVFLVESDKERSGANVTVEIALEQNRDVFALPGSITNRFSSGPHKYIQQGAKLVTCAEDILNELRPGGLFDQSTREVQAELFATVEGATDTERAILRLLRQAGQAMHIDELCRDANLAASDVNMTLVMMELKGLVQNQGGMRYSVTRLGG